MKNTGGFTYCNLIIWGGLAWSYPLYSLIVF